MTPHPIHLSIKNYQKSPKETKLRVNLPGNGDMSDPDKTKPSTGAEEDETNPDSYVQPTSPNDLYGKMRIHRPTRSDIYIAFTRTEIYRRENI